MTIRKTAVQPTGPQEQSAELNDVEMTVKEIPGVPVPPVFGAARQTVAAPVAPARHTLVEPQRGRLRETFAERPAADALPYRSVNRPPMAVLTALDDGCGDRGEEWRLRRSRTIIGRTAGDVVIPHDVDMSGEHAEITCAEKDGGYEWQLRDLKSTNGTFLRAERFVLRNGKEILLGGRRYVFRHPGVVTAVAGQAGRDIRSTQPYQPPPSNVAQQLSARLVELTAAGEGREFLLGDESALFGSDAARCRLVVVNDPFLDAEHARLFQDNRGRWVVEDRDSLNGLWVRIERVTLDRASEFQLGGQRFRFRIS
jgi:pSer/pThr/pTyr-binding forkhead associated (FHA) protein